MSARLHETAFSPLFHYGAGGLRDAPVHPVPEPLPITSQIAEPAVSRAARLAARKQKGNRDRAAGPRDASHLAHRTLGLRNDCRVNIERVWS